MKYLASIVAAAAALATIFAPAIQGVVAAHPALATVLAALYSILAHFLPSPASK